MTASDSSGAKRRIQCYRRSITQPYAAQSLDSRK